MAAAENTRYSKPIKQLLTMVLGLMFFSAIAFQLFSINKGFDITDEGYNTQLLFNKYNGITQTYFYEIIKLWFGWLPQDLLEIG
jgi:hypothetical protein